MPKHQKRRPAWLQFHQLRPKKFVTYGRCRACGKVNEVEPQDWDRAAHPRCDVCGSLLDRLGSIKNVYRCPIRRSTYGAADPQN